MGDWGHENIKEKTHTLQIQTPQGTWAFKVQGGLTVQTKLLAISGTAVSVT